MPIYEYQCNVCGKSFEEIVTSSGSGKTPHCQYCSSPNVVKKISAGSFRLSSSSSSPSAPAGALSGCSCKSGFS